MNIVEEFKKIAGDIKIIENKNEKLLYSRDIGDLPPLFSATFFRIVPDLVVQPKNGDEIKKVLSFANERKIPVIPRGTASSGFGGVIPTSGGIVIDLATMRTVIALDTENRTITVQAGARWSDIDTIAKQSGLCLMTYPSSKFSTVAGWIMTGGYGINNFKYGHVSEQVAAMSVLFPDGELKEIKAGVPDFANLIGSEGQFGIITEVTLKLKEYRKELHPRLVYFNDPAGAFTFITTFISDKVQTKELAPDTVRFLDDELLHEMNELMHADTFEKRCGVLVIFTSKEDDAAFLSYLSEKDTNGKEAPQHVASYLWNERLFGMKSKRLGPTILACEIIIPNASAPDFIVKAKRLGSRFGIAISTYAYPLNEKEAMLSAEFLCDSRKLKYLINLPMIMLLTKVALSCKARPYGLGIWFVPFITHAFDQKRRAELARYKKQVDPNAIMNRGKFFTIQSKFFNVPALFMKPAVMNALLSLVIACSWLIGPLVTLVLGKNKKVRELDRKLSTYACAKCGSCLAVCPAYLVTGNEGVTPKGKLAFARRYLAGEKITKEEADTIFFCMHCKACEEICQVNLGLVDLWEAIEGELEKKFGRPSELINDFLQKVDASEEYWEMVERNG